MVVDARIAAGEEGAGGCRGQGGRLMVDSDVQVQSCQCVTVTLTRRRSKLPVCHSPTPLSESLQLPIMMMVEEPP